MTKHCKIYLSHFGLTIADFISCEICGTEAVDIHHIFGRGKGKNTIENLMALCRDHHTDAHLEKIKKYDLRQIHGEILNKNPNKPLYRLY